MKAAFVGGGAFRLVGILREALSYPELFADGEIRLFDLNASRARAVAQMVTKTPEFSAVRCRITCPSTLEEAMEGVDMVGVILMGGSYRTHRLADKISYDHGFASSDNVSPNGAMLGLKTGATLLNIARKMEQCCPQAWLVDFANPIAVLSGMVNNHTKIQAFGICEGYTNHEWDLGRIFGRDEQSDKFAVETAGINHLSFILKGTYKGGDLFTALDRRLKPGWKMCRMDAYRGRAVNQRISHGVEEVVRFYRELGVLIFSTEGDGMEHMDYEYCVQRQTHGVKAPGPAQMNAELKKFTQARAAAQEHFEKLLGRDLDLKFWNTAAKTAGVQWAAKSKRSAFVEIMRGRAGHKVPIVTSRLNLGAVEGFTDRTVLEYSQIIEHGVFRAAGHYQVPAIMHGMLAGIANHQTMLGDAMATEDPKLLAQALLAYPIRQFSPAARSLFKQLLQLNRDEIQPKLRQAVDYL
jgi:alpha-galactosidase/6-phospho-beta-glucosidase family protein